MSLVDKIPNHKPNINDFNLDDPKSAAQYQEKVSNYNRILTMITQMQAEESTTKSNMDKARHDAVMAIVSNMK